MKNLASLTAVFVLALSLLMIQGCESESIEKQYESIKTEAEKLRESASDLEGSINDLKTQINDLIEKNNDLKAENKRLEAKLIEAGAQGTQKVGETPDPAAESETASPSPIKSPETGGTSP